jgi:hypothetical protein
MISLDVGYFFCLVEFDTLLGFSGVFAIYCWFSSLVFLINSDILVELWQPIWHVFTLALEQGSAYVLNFCVWSC